MTTEELSQSVVKMNCALNLDKKIVGVKFLFNKADFDMASAKEIKNKLNYCVMVRAAMTGRSLKAKGDSLACLAGARALGLLKTDDYCRSGQNGMKLGLYHDLATAKSVQDSMNYCDHNCYGIMVKPLDEYDDEPDVVIIISNAYNVMRIVQGYSYYYGINSHFKMSGNQAVCSEATAYPYLSNNINVSMLCIGTRHRAGWSDNELAVAFPYNLFNIITAGVIKTVNIMDDNHKKLRIESELMKNNIKDLTIRYNHNYYNDI